MGTAQPPAGNDSNKDDIMLDDVIRQINESLPHLHVIASNGRSPAKSPTRGLSKAKFSRARSVFKKMCDDSILNDQGDDIRLDNEDRRGQSGKTSA